MSPLRAFIRTQGIICAAINAVLNPLLAWLMNRHVATVPVLGGDGILVDTAITCGVMSVLVASCVSPAVRRARETGGLAPSVAGFAMLKIVYTPVLGYAVTRWVILRQMLPARSDGSRRRRVAG